jgi:hypothetical protein
MSGYITTERSRDPEFLLAMLDGQPLPGVEPGSVEEAELRAAAADAIAVGNAAPPMTPEQVVTVAAMLSRRSVA